MTSRRRFLQLTAVGAALPALARAGDAQVATLMASGRPSSTAQGAAALRAAHQVLDAPLLLPDPFALKILGPTAEAWVTANTQYYEARSTLRAYVVLRSRYAEDGLARAVKRGIDQYVLLGAGLDTFGYRNPHRGLKVFEVDHPATQRWKRERLTEADIAVPRSVTYAPVDFERETLAQGLARAGFDATRPAYFSMLGVVIYLTKPALRETLGFVASLPRGSEIAFSYAVSNDLLTDGQKSGRVASAKQVAAIGEPWISYYEPAALAWELGEIGFGRIDDLDGPTANARYFGGRKDGLQVSGSSRLMSARV